MANSFMGRDCMRNFDVNNIYNYEGFAMGIPIVTLPGEFMRSRVAYACYQQMDFTDCVAESPEQYIKIAVKLGTDKKYRQTIQQKIADNRSILYENMTAVQEIEDFLISAFAEKG